MRHVSNNTQTTGGLQAGRSHGVVSSVRVCRPMRSARQVIGESLPIAGIEKYKRIAQAANIKTD